MGTWQVIALALFAACGETIEEQAAREKLVKDAAEHLCTKGTPNARAKPPKGKRPIMQVYKVEEGTSTSWIPAALPGQPAPKTVEELALVVCIVTDKTYVSSCDYGPSGGATSSYSIRKYQRIETWSMHDAATAKKLGEKRFEGEKPSENCDASVSRSGDSRYETSSEVTGGGPKESDTSAFLKPFVDGP